MLIYLPLTLLCLLVAWLCLQQIAWELRAARLTPGDDQPAARPLISVLIPARNEARRISPLLQGLAAQSYRAFEVIVVDDESTDGTAELVRGYAGSLPALTLLPGAPLPAGWAGKCWACWQAASHAQGEWLLFLDADVAPRPALLGALASRALGGSYDLVTLMPLLRLGSLAERLVLPAFGTILHALYPLARVSGAAGQQAFAIGQCLFIRRAAYQAVGGHRAVQASVLEDVDLAKQVAAGGFRLHAANAPDLLAVRMYTDWGSLREGLGKNAVAGFKSGGQRSLWVGISQALVALTPAYLLLAAALVAASQPLLALVLLLHGLLLGGLALGCAAWLVQRRYRLPAAWGLAYPLGLAIYFGLAFSALRNIRRGQGVVWKGRRLVG